MPDSPIIVPSASLSTPIPLSVRNNIYSALMSSSSGGIPAIQAVLTHELQSSGWISDLRAYITLLLRSGECTSVKEVMERVLAEVQLGDLEKKNGVNGAGMSNGVNGNGYKENGNGTEDVNLRLPERAIREGVRVVRRELDKVCEITVEE